MTQFRLKLYPRIQSTPCLFAGMGLLLLSASGCHQRAYNELYVENMATEIRLLEDRVYEYDAEYRALENELEDLQAINEGLEARLRDAEQEQSNRLRPSKAATPKSDAPVTAEPKSTTPKPAAPKPAAPKESLKLPPGNEIQLEVETPEPPPLKKPSIPESGDLPPPDRSSSAPRGLPSTVARASYEERRIAAPTVPPDSVSEAVQARGASEPQNTRVRQIEFHPGLCRGIKRDGDPSETGIALVLVPRNNQHEFAPVSGKVAVVLEETLEGEAHRLGKWEFSAEEIAELLEPVGSGQGIHLRLLWQENRPKTQLLDVYVRFTDDQGITMVNHRQIHLRKSTPGQSTWTPK
jgi:hypothetical protein